MEGPNLQKCENCGGALQAVDANTLKCPYCGERYSTGGPEYEAPQSTNMAVNRTPRHTININKIIFFVVLAIVGLIFLFFLVVFIAGIHAVLAGRAKT